MRHLLVLIGVVAAFGVVALGGYAVAQDNSATPTVVHAATPEILPELCETISGVATPVDMASAVAQGAEATPALFPCGTPEAAVSVRT
jgi:queuine/archaeosine tRNA-ribosyltransferase